MRSRRKICSNVALTELVPAPDEPVMEMIGCLTDMGARPGPYDKANWTACGGPADRGGSAGLSHGARAKERLPLRDLRG